MLGDDHPDTLASATNLAVDLRNLGEYQAARELDEDTLARYRRVLGDDHPDTLASANNLAADLRNLGEHQAARELDEDTLARRRRVLGDDHPDTLASANNLAVDLRDLGEHQAARELDEDTLARYRRVLGDDHPDTLTSANNLAVDLSGPGRASGGPRAGRGHPGPPAAGCSATTTPTPWPRRATSPPICARSGKPIHVESPLARANIWGVLLVPKPCRQAGHARRRTRTLPSDF